MLTFFELPQEQLAHVRPLGADGTELTAEALQRLELEGSCPSGEEAGPSSAAAAAAPRDSGSTCIACGVGVGGAAATRGGFSSVEEQRAHFRTDWHRYNVKRRVAGLPPVSEEAFTALVDREDQDALGSLSGSESGDSEDPLEHAAADTGALAGVGGRSAGPQLQFALPGGEQYAVWRCLLAPDPASRAEVPPSDASCLQQLQQLATQRSRWAIILSRGGHFAAAVYDVSHEQLAAGAKPGAQQEKLEAVAHKSFHRYVVRAGQGGKQSGKDASGKYAKSAGSRLRRHNEAALERDIQETLRSWKELLGGCSLVLVHAPSSNSAVLFGGESPLLDKSDPRIRRIPFTTRRPTYSETKRVVRMLASAYEIQQQQPAAAAGSQQQQQQQAGPKDMSTEAAAAEPAQRREDGSKQQAAAAAASGSEAQDDAGAAAEAAAASKKAEKRARQKAKQKEARAAEAAANKAAAESAASAAAEDEIGRAAALAVAAAARQQPKPATAGAKAGAQAAAGGASNSKASSSTPPPPPRLSAKPRANEDAATKRARMAAAAEARMKALQAASAQQQLY